MTSQQEYATFKASFMETARNTKKDYDQLSPENKRRFKDELVPILKELGYLGLAGKFVRNLFSMK